MHRQLYLILAMVLSQIVACGDPSTFNASEPDLPSDAPRPADALTEGDVQAADGQDPTTSRDVGSDAKDSDTDAALSGDVVAPPAPQWAVPCAQPQLWPFALASTTRPFVVRYQEQGDVGAAETVRDAVERAWTLNVDTLGFRAPPDDLGICGDDGRYDVYLWRHEVAAYVDAVAENPLTPHDDRLSYMVVDPWGPYGGALLPFTISHELNHACQTADDWFDAGAVYEMTSTFVEALVDPASFDWALILPDFQTRAHWALDHYDDYETWYMYGASLYFHFLQHRYFEGDAAFIGSMWHAMRNPPGAEDDPSLNEPDWVDAIDALLTQHAGVAFEETLQPFGRWRWLIAAGDGARQPPFASTLPADAAIPLAADESAAQGQGQLTLEPGVAPTGAAYVRLSAPPHTALRVQVEVAPPQAPFRAMIQALAEGSESPTPQPGASTVETSVPASGARVFALTVLPPIGSLYDPDEAPSEPVVMGLSWTERR